MEFQPLVFPTSWQFHCLLIITLCPDIHIIYILLCFVSVIRDCRQSKQSFFLSWHILCQSVMCEIHIGTLNAYVWCPSENSFCKKVRRFWHIFFCSEGWFDLHVKVNSQNNRFWSSHNLRLIHQVSLCF